MVVLLDYMGKAEEFHFPPEIDEEYQKFCYELFLKDKKGEKIDYAKESANFWNQKIREAIESRKKSKKNSKI